MSFEHRPLHLVVALAVLLPVTAAANSKDKARELVERATAAHADGRFADALTDLTVAYALDPDPQLLFAMGQIHVKLGQCGEAITFYKRFLETRPTRDEEAVVQEAIRRCNDTSTAPVVTPPPAEIPPVAAPVAAPAAAPLAVASVAPWYTDWIGDALVGGGAACGIAGLLLYRSALDSRERADAAATYEAYEALLDSAQGKRTLSVVVAAGGVVLVGAGVLRFALGDRTTERSVAVVPARGGGFVTWGARF